MSPHRIFTAIRALALIAILSFSAFAQSERGTITGAVKDASGALVPGAKVTVTNAATNVVIAAVTNDSGEFSVPSLSPGSYDVRVEKTGFRPAEIRGIPLDAAQTVREDATLEVGSSTQAIEVQASAVQLQTEDAKNTVTLQNKLVDDLPLVVAGTIRSPFDLAALVPDAKNLGGDNGFALGGGQAASYGTSLDGVSTNTSRALSKSWVVSNAPSVEAIDQVSVDTNGFKAEYGHAGGGNMTFVSKSGTNVFHGSAYEFLRNNDFDANNFFNNRAGIPISIYKQNDFGATIGGPVWIPKVYRGKDKTFFFFNYEGFRNRSGANGATFTIPTPEMYGGDFSKWVDKNGNVIPIYDPTTQAADGTRTPFAGNIIPKSKFSPLALKALAVFQGSGTLAPNNGAQPGTNAYVSNNYLVNNGTQIFPVNKTSIKGDHIFNDKHRISGYFAHDREHQTPGPDGPPTLPGLYTSYNDLLQASDVVRFSWDWTFSANKINHFYAGGNNWAQDHKPPQEYTGNWKDKFCLPNVPDCNDNLVNLFSGGNGNRYSQWGGNADNGSENTVYAYNDDFTWIKGNHTFKFGGMYQLNHYNGFGRQCISGCVGFSYTETGKVVGGSVVTDPNQGGNEVASFLLGYADHGSLDTIRFIGQQFYYFGGYFQDDWRVTPKLVLNLGLRWDGNLPPTGLENRWTDFSPTTPNPGAGNIPGAVIFSGDCQGCVGSRRLANFWTKGFGPHIGAAYSWDQKTVIRAAYARSFGSLVSVSGSTHNNGYTLTQNFDSSNTGLTPTFLLDSGLPPWTAPPFVNPSVANGSSPAWFQGDETTKLPAYDNINFSIQRQVGGSMVAEVGYSGVMGEHLQSQLIQINSLPASYLTKFGTVAQSIAILNSPAVGNTVGVAIPYSGFKGTVAQALRPFPQYNGIDTYAGQGDHSGHSSYHSLQVKFQKRYSAGLTFTSSYVFSKLLTDSDTAWGSGYAADQFNRRLEKSIGQFDVTHDFKLGLTYDTPFGKGQKYLNKGFVGQVVGNWRISSINLYARGTPVGIGTSESLPIYAPGFGGRVPAYVTSYDNWQPSSWKNGSFDPSVDSFLAPSCNSLPAAQQSGYSGPIPCQGTSATPNFYGLGNVTRYNPKVHLFPNLTENVSLTRSFPIWEKTRLEFRAEAFNVFNRVRFGTGSTQVQSSTFGNVASSGAGGQINTPRQLQLALKLYF